MNQKAFRLFVVIALALVVVPVVWFVNRPATAQTRTPTRTQSQAQRDALHRATDLSLAFQEASKAVAPTVVFITATQRAEARSGRGPVDEFFERYFGREAPRGRVRPVRAPRRYPRSPAL